MKAEAVPLREEKGVRKDGKVSLGFSPESYQAFAGGALTNRYKGLVELRFFRLFKQFFLRM